MAQFRRTVAPVTPLRYSVLTEQEVHVVNFARPKRDCVSALLQRVHYYVEYCLTR